MNSLRRGILSTPPPTDALKFPIYLVEGDNGQLGIDLYNWLETNLYNWNPDTQNVYIDGYEVYVIEKYGNYYILHKAGYPNLLNENGYTIIMGDSGGGSD